MRTAALAAVLTAGIALTIGCAQINVSADIPRREHVDSSRVPPTRNHQEARQELEKAYRYIRRLEHDVAKLKDDKRDLKADKKKYKDLYEHCRDRLEEDD